MTQREEWNTQKSYHEGERCRYGGHVWEAKFDLARHCGPFGPHHLKFWRRVPTIGPFRSEPAKSAPNKGEPTVTVTASRFRELLDMAKGNVPAPRGYITRDMSIVGKQGR